MPRDLKGRKTKAGKTPAQEEYGDFTKGGKIFHHTRSYLKRQCFVKFP